MEVLRQARRKDKSLNQHRRRPRPPPGPLAAERPGCSREGRRVRGSGALRSPGDHAKFAGVSIGQQVLLAARPPGRHPVAHPVCSREQERLHQTAVSSAACE